MEFLINDDNGYPVTKIYDGFAFVEIPSLVCDEEDIKIIQDMTDTKDIMIAEVISEKNGIAEIKNVAVGNIAKSGRARYNFQVNKVDSPTTIYPSIVSFAYLLLNYEIDYAELDITTTLTIDDFKYEDNIRKFKEVFCKEWTVTFKYGNLKDKKCNFEIKDNLTSAQCAVGIWDYVLDEDSKIVVPVKNKKILGIDIGFETTDICVMDNLQFDSERSFTLTVGMSDYNQKIVREINSKYRTRKSVEDMEMDLKKGTFGIVDISLIQEKYYKKLVEEIINGISGIASSTIEFSDIILLGGGANHTFKIFKEHSDFNRIKLIPEPHLSNVRGSRKLSKIIWGDRNYANI